MHLYSYYEKIIVINGESVKKGDFLEREGFFFRPDGAKWNKI
jgi:hypothetical protein